MSRRPTLLAGLGGLALTLLLLVPARAQISDYSPQLTVEGLVGAPRTYTVDSLRRLPVTDVAIQGVDDAITRAYRGVSLYDLLLDADPLFDPARPTDPLIWYVVVSAGEDRSAVIAWGEIDPSFEGKPVIVAYARDGQPLGDTQGMAQLVVPFDRRGQRGVANIRTITLVRAQPDAGEPAP
jgi:DMSO/TMAO reductase YedYZ molybdopterin-dependent catalytic subunit